MDPKSSDNSEVISNIRNMSISRRGGVRTRGGRLPPVNLREINQITSSKKVVAPKIPQRRKNIKKESDGEFKPLIKKEGTDSTPNSRGRGRGRQQKVLLQTEGSFLAEGPAAKLKRDHPIYDDTFSMSRGSRKSANADRDVKVDPDIIKNLLESYEADDVYEDDIGTKAPYRLPLFKENPIGKIKLKPEDDEIIEIKKEFKEEDKINIKKEIKIKMEEHFHNKMKMKSMTVEDFQAVKDNGLLLLLQLPQLSVVTVEKSPEKKSKDKQPEKDETEKMSSNFIDNLEEGLIGKLQIMKSGKIKALFGDISFELDDGVPSESYLEAVSIEIGEGEGDVTILGKIEKKMILRSVVNSFNEREDISNGTG